jgi:hypothetical protein
VELEISPEPSEEEREAIERALGEDKPTPHASEWRRAGVEENLSDGSPPE